MSADTVRVYECTSVQYYKITQILMIYTTIPILYLYPTGCIKRTFNLNDVLLFSKTFKGRQGKLTFIINVI